MRAPKKGAIRRVLERQELIAFGPDGDDVACAVEGESPRHSDPPIVRRNGPCCPELLAGWIDLEGDNSGPVV